jgi:hypothetical protein
MDAVTKCDGLSVWAVEDEPIRLRERFGVPVGGREYQEHGVARPDGVLTSSDILQGLASDELVRRYQTHQFLDRRGPAGRVLRELCADVGQLEKHSGAVSDQARRVFVTRDEQQHDVCEKLLLSEPVLRLPREQTADDVVSAIGGATAQNVSTNPCKPSPAALTRTSSAELSVLMSRTKGSRKSSHHCLS